MRGHREEPNRHRIAGPYFDDNFGVVEVDWEAADPRVTLALHAARGGVVLRHELRLSEISGPGRGSATGRSE